MEYINNKYISLCAKRSDINEHLPVLYEYAKKANVIFETGVRGVISSWALTKGLLENNSNKKVLIMNDIRRCNNMELLNATKDLPIKIESIWKNNLEVDIKDNVDITFIDTWHIYGQLKRELDKFSKITTKYIIMHDTTVDEIYGETIRCRMNAELQSKQSGYPIEEIKKGLGPAIKEFLDKNKNWVIEKKLTNNNGLTILKKI